MSASHLFVLTVGLAALASSASAAELKAVGPVSANGSGRSLSAQFPLETGGRWETRAESATVHGTRTVRLQQTWHGIPVFDQVLTVEQDPRGHVRQAFGNLAQGLRADLPSPSARLRPAQAVARLMQVNGLSSEAMQRATQRSARLYVLIEGGRARLAYLTSYLSEEHGRATRPQAFVDADTGAVLRQWDAMAHFDAEGPGGNDRIGRYYYGRDGKPFLDVTKADTVCTMENANVVVLDYQGGNTPSKYTFTCPVSLGAAFNDAHHWGNAVVHMYQAYLGQRPLAHKLSIGLNRPAYDSCSWNGTQLSCGRRDGASLPTLDMIGHEASHGFTQANSGLVYSGQSGGINESFSDMAGEASEYFDRGVTDFVVGAEMFSDMDRGLRWMCEPRRDGQSIDQLADYTPGMPVHQSSGLYNKAFCTLAKSGGWDVKSAFRAFARANQLYWSANEPFVGGATKVAKAACDLGYPVADVVASFARVGIDAGDVPCEAPPLKADFSFSAAGLKISFSNLSTGMVARQTWDFGDGHTASEPDPAHTYAKPGTYTARLTVTDREGASDTKSHQVVVAGDGSVLINDVPVSAAGRKGEQRFYTFEASGQGPVRVQLSGGSGDADLYVRFGSRPSRTSYDCRPYRSGNAETCHLPAKAGTFHVLLDAYRDYDGATLVASERRCGAQCVPPLENATNFPIADLGSVESPISAAGLTGNASGTSEVAVSIRHAYSGDLVIELIAPDGTAYRLRDRTGGSTDDVRQTFTLDLSAKAREGTWKLRVRDAARGDTGVLEGWSLSL